MAEGFLKKMYPSYEIHSAGTKPSGEVHPKAVVVMNDVGIDLSTNKPKNAEVFLNTDFDFVITVCGGAKESCPTFSGKVKRHLHIGFDDPAEAKGSEEEIYKVFRRVRDEIKTTFNDFNFN